MPDYTEEFMQAEKMDHIVEEMEMLILDALLSIVQKLQDRVLRHQRLDKARHPGRPYF